MIRLREYGIIALARFYMLPNWLKIPVYGFFSVVFFFIADGLATGVWDLSTLISNWRPYAVNIFLYLGNKAAEQKYDLEKIALKAQEKEATI